MRLQLVLSVCLLWAGSASGQLCQDWVNTPTPSPGSQSNLLFDVAVTRADTALAVGRSEGAAGLRPLLARWNGQSWTPIELPDTSGLGTFPQVWGAGRSPSGDIWVVGHVRTTYPTDQLPLLMRWRDGMWDDPVTPTLRPQNTYPFGARGGLAYDAAATGSNDVWVVGAAAGYGDATATIVPLALHFDGSHWSDVPVPLVGNRHHELDKISASASDNVWAVGTWRSIAGAFQALIVRWDGSAWSRIANPGEGPNGGGAQAVLALSPNDVWVSGSFDSGATRLIHWNGSNWERPTTGIPGLIVSFAATSPSDIWAADGTNATFYHFNGMTWTLVQGVSFPGAEYVLRGWGMDSYDTCGVWAVGGYSDGAMQRTFAERLTPPPCPADFNADGAVNSQDFFEYLAAFFVQEPRADFNGDGSVDSRDFYDFLAVFFAGCP